jgi:hypothetical protein
MSDNPSTDRPTLEEIKRLLADIPSMQTVCGLDLLVFLYRHPRTLLTNEQLAAFVGYDMEQVAKAIDAFTDAGILKLTQSTTNAARLYLVFDDAQCEGLTKLAKLASTRQGRREVLQLLDHGSPIQRTLSQGSTQHGSRQES